MADLEINYKGSKIAELSASGTKTLLTQGKYCEGNVAVNYASPLHRWSVTFASRVTSVSTLLTDSWLAQNWNNEKLVVEINATSTIDLPTSGAALAFAVAQNICLGAEDRAAQISCTIKSGGASYGSCNYRLMDGGSHNGGEMSVTSDGQLKITCTTLTFLEPQTYQIFAFLRG